MSRLRTEDGIALVTTIILTSVMLIMGWAILGLVVTQTGQTSTERRGESAFNLAEATLNANAFLLGRSWPQTPVAGTCGNNELTDNLDPTQAATTPLAQQIKSILTQTYDGSGTPTASNWWVMACAEGGRDSWDDSLRNGLSYDTAPNTLGPRRMWVRAEAHVNGRKRAVVGLVQAAHQPTFPANLAVVTGALGADVRSTANQALTGSIVGPLLTNLLGGSGKPIAGKVGLRCSLLDNTAVLGCLSGLYKATSLTTLSSLLHANDYVDFPSDKAVSPLNVAQLRQQAITTGTYFANVAVGASCLPAGSTGKVVFIEQVGNGTGSCVLNTASGAQAAALVVGSGGVRVTRAGDGSCPAGAVTTTTGPGTFRGIIYALHDKAIAANPTTNPNGVDVRIECGSRVFGAVFADDNPKLGAAKHGQVEVVPPPIDLTTIISNLPLCQGLAGGIVCAPVLAIAGGPVDAVVNLLATLGVNATTLAAAIVPQLNQSLPAVTYNNTIVKAVTTFGDSGVVNGTFREVRPIH